MDSVCRILLSEVRRILEKVGVSSFEVRRFAMGFGLVLPDSILFMFRFVLPFSFNHVVKWVRSDVERSWRVPYPVKFYRDELRDPFNLLLDLLEEYDDVTGGLIFHNQPQSGAFFIGTYWGEEIPSQDWTLLHTFEEDADRFIHFLRAMGLISGIYVRPVETERATVFKAERLEWLPDYYISPGIRVFPSLNIAIIDTGTDAPLEVRRIFLLYPRNLRRTSCPVDRMGVETILRVMKDYRYAEPRIIIEELGIDRIVHPVINVEEVRPLLSYVLKNLLQQDLLELICRAHRLGISTRAHVTPDIGGKKLHIVAPGAVVVSDHESYLIDNILKKLERMTPLINVNVLSSRVGVRTLLPTVEVKRGGYYYYIILPSFGLPPIEDELTGRISNYIPVVAYRSDRSLRDIMDMLPILALETEILPLDAAHCIERPSF